MKSLDEYIAAAAKGGETRSGIILGIRLALVGLRELGVEAPAKDRSLVTFVELDRCLPDAVQLVTGCRLGNRTLKFVDHGKMAATFVDLKSDRAVRVAARENANRKARKEFSDLENEEALRRAYRNYPDEVLFKKEWVSLDLPPEERPGQRAGRVLCAACGEGISFNRQVKQGESVLCRACAGQRYFHSA